MSLSSIESPYAYYEEEEGVNRSAGLGLINLHSLTRLELDDVIFITFFFGDVPSSTRCSGLESLSLNYMHISLDSLSNIISSCPSIRKLSLSNLFNIEEQDGVGSIGDYNLTTVNNHHSLTCLELFYVEFDISSFLSSFPNLKDLTLHTMDTSSHGEEIRIASLSLERLNFRVDKLSSRYGLDGKKVRFEFDVQSIRRFTYECTTGVIPPLSIKTTSREWESRVSITHYKKLDILWFRKLNKLLTKLRRSKIHLSLDVSCWTSFHYEAGEIRGLCRRRPRVENLTVDVGGLPTLSCYAFYDGLFLLCRPKFITQYLHHGKAKNEYFLCRRLVERVGVEKLSFESHFMYHGLLDLEEVKVAVFDKAVGVWRDVPLMESLLDAALEDELKVRFQFKWKCKK